MFEFNLIYNLFNYKMDDESLIYNLWRIRRTYLQQNICKTLSLTKRYMDGTTMAHDRGYIVTQKELSATLDQFKEEYGDKPFSQLKPSRTDLSTLIAHSKDPSSEVVIVMYDETKIGVKHIRTLCQRMQDENIKRSIVIVQNAITPSAKQCMNSMAPKYILESFLESELMVNITEHKLVPTHIVLDPEDCQELLKRYKIKEYQLPKIQQTDPVSRYYGAEIGQIFKIIRISETAGRYITYRIVV
ncbi:hypothetical protein A3Q56_05095 [Intoshia linei]|uniref:DNA-directed RNA polymerases I, II, and III subunit RPABC1 n=1 Tax=Intoshia linei TaxID=1819745 RepID=A0A177AYR2_9BILA|nr:hypothetical protein A3Q56_05095 [Intoshia linei]